MLATADAALRDYAFSQITKPERIGFGRNFTFIQSRLPSDDNLVKISSGQICYDIRAYLLITKLDRWMDTITARKQSSNPVAVPCSHVVLMTGCMTAFKLIVTPIILTVIFSYITPDHVLAQPDLFPNSGDDLQEVGPCEACRLVVKSFEEGIERTSRGKHEGGDTSWEERKLKSYADSEVRLIEIQEKLCEDVKKGKAQCLSLAEDTESEVEEWWFKQRAKNVRLHDYLCINKLKRCCPTGRFGPNCQQCFSNCNKHGDCNGSGTRAGTGKCDCEAGYSGDECEKCDESSFRVATNGHFTCRSCDSACAACYGPGPTNCTECRPGYYQHETNGCIDINECESSASRCAGNTYCVNTDGSYRCADCHVSCAGCVGYGPSMCINCARGYKLDDEYSCRSEEQLDNMERWGQDDGFRQNKNVIARYFFYVGVLAASMVLFRSNLYVMYTFTLGFIVVLLLSEFNLLDEIQNYSKMSSE